MGIPAFDEVMASKVTKLAALHFLGGAVVGIHAAYYLSTLPESLLSAIGGSPLALARKIEKEIGVLKETGVELHFVFDGLDYGAREDPLGRSEEVNSVNSHAFTLYEASEPAHARDAFQKSDSSKATTMAETLMKTLHELKVPFTVAPYSALAQLAYYLKHPSHFIDAIYGPSELFCFGVDRIITRFALSTKFRTTDIDRKAFSSPSDESFFNYIDRPSCLEELGNIHAHVFIDALMLVGPTLLLPKFPHLTNTPRYKGDLVREAVDLVLANGGSVSRLCARYNDTVTKDVYLDQYKRAMASIKHHVVLTAEGDVETMEKDNAPSDAHEWIGLRLPEELYMYLSRGMIRPRALNWLTYGTIYIPAPLAGQDAEPYRTLVGAQLDPLRRQAISLLTDPIHRYYQTKEITTKTWYDKDSDRKFNSKTVVPSPRETVSKWNVKDELIEEITVEGAKPGTLSFAVRSLSNDQFASKTITTKQKAGPQALKSRQEVLANTVWRFLQLRGYVDEQHKLTSWGKVLEAALIASGPSRDFEEPVFLAIELLRFDLVKEHTMFSNYAGAPEHGSTHDKAYCMLVSRIACLGRIRHEPVAYSGPLSRHLLAYHSMISSVQYSLRDLLEMNMAAMFLEGSVDRDRRDWMDLSLSLPFPEERSCALGILTMQYLDNLLVDAATTNGATTTTPTPTAESTRRETREQGQTWFKSADFAASLDDAFRLWDAVYAALAAAGPELVPRERRALWDTVDGWLRERR